MKKINLALFLFTVLADLFAQNINEYDAGYIASVKNNKCFKVSDYPGKDVKPSTLQKNKSCEIISNDESIKSLIIVCADKAADKTTIYLYTMNLENCSDSLEAAKKRLK